MTDARTKNFSLTVDAPIHREIVTFNGKDISYWEKFFINRRDSTHNLILMRDYDRCHAILKYAGSCGAVLTKVAIENHIISFTFAFDCKERLDAFDKDLDKAVKGVTM